MRILTPIFCFTTLVFFGFTTQKSLAQNGNLQSEQPQKVTQLLQLKKQLKKDDKRYRIQIYNGNQEVAQKALSNAKNEFEITAELTFEYPNYKVRLGKFRTRLEADKHLIEVRGKYPGAFILALQQ